MEIGVPLRQNVEIFPKMPDRVCQLRVLKIEQRVLPMRTRFPFRYGIASLSALPHLFLSVTLEVDGKTVTGISSEGLPPKWFTKNPETSMEQDLADMLAVIQNACRLSQVFAGGQETVTFYALWEMLQREMGQWAPKQRHPGLLWQLGVSLVERAVLDAICKSCGIPLHDVIRGPVLGISWEVLLPVMGVQSVADFLPDLPLEKCWVRHTVGLADPLRGEDIPAEERLHDGLPQSLEECIRFYGLRYFKIKLSGNLEVDVVRLRGIAKLLIALCGDDFAVTLDGNENYHDIGEFRSAHNELKKDAEVRVLLEHALWIEQPLHRDYALRDEVGSSLQDWQDAPRLIIDESDGEPGSAAKALALGYSGVSHKNCKGIIKGLINAALIWEQRRLQPKRDFVISGEDLANVGPVALLQDLAMQSLLGVTHVERNGHHYFKGLSMYSRELQDAVIQQHPNLYAITAEGDATLSITDGQLALASVNAAPFGCGIVPDLSALPTLKEWIMTGGMQAL